VLSAERAVRRGRAAAADLSRLVSRDAPTMDERRRLTADVAQALTAAGYPRHFVPRRFGGRAGAFTRLLKDVAQLGESCASTAWCATLYAAHGRLAAYLPEAGRQDLWRSSPDVRIAASVVPPQGEAVHEGNGWLLSGSWAFASGVDHADWVLLASSVGDGAKREHRIFVVPREELDVQDTWRTLGLRGTGSNTVVATRVFVPGHRAMLLADLSRPQHDGARCHAVPYPMVAALMFAAPVLGAARGALGHLSGLVSRPRRSDGRPLGAAHSVRESLARSSAQIHSAALLLEHAALRADRGEITRLAVAENQRDAAMAAELCSDAVDGLFRSCGMRAQAEADPVQRAWRDVSAAAGHAALRFEAAADAYADASAESLSGDGR
jgi:two-component flavin-dependent monooxygenase